MDNTSITAPTLKSALFTFFLLTAGGFFFLHQAHAQTHPPAEIQSLLELSEEFSVSEKELRREAEELALEKGFPLRFEDDRGVVYELMRLVNGVPEYFTTHNATAAISTSTHYLQEGGSTFLNLSGDQMPIGKWDAGAVMLHHQELRDRSIQRDGATEIHNHAIHVAGTLMAAGVRPEARGMAPKAILWAYDWSNDASEMAQAASEGLLISNHSYGSLSGWAHGSWSGNSGWHWFGDTSIDPQEDYKFGYYDDRAAQWDQISYLAPHYLIVKSAGNNRNDNHEGQHYVFNSSGGWVSSTDFRNPSGGSLGYDCIPTYGNAKNILTVGAVNSIPGGYSQPSDVRMSNFSSWGPTDDGRIKPDLVGDGVNLLSSGAGGVDVYRTSSGTSMSGPNVAGSLLLIQELHQNLKDQYMRSASLRGLAIHTVDQTGESEGPDYSFGWGLLNSKRAAEFLLDPGYNLLLESEMHSGDTMTWTFYSNGVDPVKATLCWTDPPAHPRPPALNDRTPRLRNDLDMRILAVSGTDSGSIFFPYILDPEIPTEPATTGDNFRDNVEVINPGVLPKGEYLLHISHKRDELINDHQDFSLLLSAPPSDCNIELKVTHIDHPDCADHKSGTVVLEASGGAEPYSYSLDGIEFLNSEVLEVSSLHKTYAYARDANGCVGRVEFVVEPADPIVVDLSRDLRIRVLEPLTDRASISFTNSYEDANWGGDAKRSDPIQSELVAVNDGSASPLLACNNIVNGAELQGKVAIARRGSCQFSLKALRAEEAGATALIIVDHQALPHSMQAGDFGEDVSIPVFMIGRDEGEHLLELLETQQVIVSLGSHEPRTPSSCWDAEDGSVFPFVYGGQGPYEYEWSNGSTTEKLENVARGSFTLTVTDALGCTFSSEIKSQGPPAIRANFHTVENISCPGSADGSIIASAIGGKSPYQFEWSTGITGQELHNLAVGLYFVTITDANGCSGVDSIYIKNPEELGLSAANLQHSCHGDANGQIEIVPSGGTAPFQISWDVVNSDSLFVEQLAPGNYSFTITDHCGFTFEDQVQLGIYDALEIEIDEVIMPECGNDATGFLRLKPNPDIPLADIQWSNSEQELELENLKAGIYAYQITDICGIVRTGEVEITAPPPLIINSLKEDALCPGEATGEIEVDILGGLGAYHIFWSTGDTTRNISQLPAGDYHVTVLDSTGCTAEKSFTISEPDSLRVGFNSRVISVAADFTNRSNSEQWLWDFGDGNTSELENPQHIFAEAGEYRVCLTAFNPCDTLTHCEWINIQGSLIPEDQSLYVYPNPSSHTLHIEVKNYDESEMLRVYDASGKEMLSFPPAPFQRIDISQLPDGLYLIQSGREAVKFIKN